MAQARQRRHHNRSRTGCTTCKRRHLRCDETRPACKRCLIGGHDCEYPDMEIWRSDDNVRRPSFVGQQAWSAVWQLPGGPRSVDPFDSLPTGMPLKSRQLFQYFVQVHKDQCSTPLSEKQIKRSIHYPDSFRSVLLLAALHFSWNTGELGQYETTYLTHKIECIRSINQLLDKPSKNVDAIRSYLSVIATLCLVETSTGNLRAAEAHLEGLMALVDAGKAIWPIDDITRDINGVLQRYIIICIQEILRLRTRIKSMSSSVTPTAEANLAFADEQTRGAVQPIGDFTDRLVALWIMPYLHLANQDLTAGEIDAADFIDYLRLITNRRGGCWPSPRDKSPPSEKWVGTGALITNFFLWGVTERGDTPSPPPSSSETFLGSWIGLSITTGFYLYGVVGLGEAQEAIDGRALRWILRVMQRDIDQSFDESMAHRVESGAYWLWKLVLGAFGVVGAWMAALAAGNVEKSIFGGEATFLELRAWFYAKIRFWSKLTGITKWEDVRDILAIVVWPRKGAGEPLAIMIWEQALAKVA